MTAKERRRGQADATLARASGIVQEWMEEVGRHQRRRLAALEQAIEAYPDASYPVRRTFRTLLYRLDAQFEEAGTSADALVTRLGHNEEERRRAKPLRRGAAPTSPEG